MSKLFEQTEINGMKLKNRFARSATWEGMADERGAVTDRLVELYAELARGEVGLIILSHAFVRREGQAGLGQLGIYGDELIDGYRKLVQAVHDNGGVIAAQLAHGGMNANPDLSGLARIAPTGRIPGDDREAEELTAQGIADVTVAFAEAAVRSKECGFDAVQIHSAHTYLLNQFLSPHFNRRTDQFGGSVENRMKPLLQVYAAVRAAVGDDYPVMLKINSEDFLPDGDGLNQADSMAACLKICELGIDCIEISGGNLKDMRFRPARAFKWSPEKEVFYREYIEKLRPKLNCPLMLCGGIRSWETAEKLVDDNLIDYVSLSRPLIREPDLIKRWQAGDRRPSSCINDNRCYEPIYVGEGMYCVTAAKQAAKKG